MIRLALVLSTLLAWRVHASLERHSADDPEAATRARAASALVAAMALPSYDLASVAIDHWVAFAPTHERVGTASTMQARAQLRRVRSGI